MRIRIRRIPKGGQRYIFGCALCAGPLPFFTCASASSLNRYHLFPICQSAMRYSSIAEASAMRYPIPYAVQLFMNHWLFVLTRNIVFICSQFLPKMLMPCSSLVCSREVVRFCIAGRGGGGQTTGTSLGTSSLFHISFITVSKLGTELNSDSQKVISSIWVHKFRTCQVTWTPSYNILKVKTLILREILYGIWVDNRCQSYDPLPDLSHFIIRY